MIVFNSVHHFAACVLFAGRYRKAFVDYRTVLNLGSNSDIAQQGSDR